MVYYISNNKFIPQYSSLKLSVSVKENEKFDCACACVYVCVMGEKKESDRRLLKEMEGG